MPNELQRHIETTAFSFRGYNVRNLGKTPELLAHPLYGPTIERHLREAGEICSSEIGRPVDLVRRVVERSEPDLDHYAEAVALVMAVEFAQIELLQNFFGVHFSEAKLAFGYSLGELAAVACAGVMSPENAMRVPIALAADAAALAHNAQMGVLFSRGPTIDETDVRRLCRQITAEGNGTIGISAILSPNTYLLLGQNDTIARFAATDARSPARAGPPAAQPRSLAAAAHRDRPPEAHPRPRVGDDGADARRLRPALPAGGFARDRQAELRRPPRPRHPPPLGRSAAAAVGRGLRNARLAA